MNTITEVENITENINSQLNHAVEERISNSKTGLWELASHRNKKESNEKE